MQPNTTTDHKYVFAALAAVLLVTAYASKPWITKPKPKPQFSHPHPSQEPTPLPRPHPHTATQQTAAPLANAADLVAEMTTQGPTAHEQMLEVIRAQRERNAELIEEIAEAKKELAAEKEREKRCEGQIALLKVELGKLERRKWELERTVGRVLVLGREAKRRIEEMGRERREEK